MAGVNKWLSRLLAISILLLIVVAVYATALAPLARRYVAVYEESDNLRTQISQYRRIARRKTDLLAKLNQLETSPDTAKIYWRGKTAAIAGANLQTRANQLVQKRNGVIQSIATLPGELEDGVQTFGIRVLFSANIQSIQQILHDVEIQSPILIVNSFEIRNKHRRRRRNKKNREEPDILLVDLQISGFLMKGGK